MQALNAAPHDPKTVGADNWREMWRNRLESKQFWPAKWLEHWTYDETWRRGSICENNEDIQALVRFFGVWVDLCRDTPLRIAQHTKCPLKVLMSPWAHLHGHEASPKPQMDFVAELIRSWDHWLIGKDTELMDARLLRFFLQDSAPTGGSRKARSGIWVEEPAWPSSNVKTHKFWMNDGTLGDTPTPRKALSICSPQTLGSTWGDMCSFDFPGDIALDCCVDSRGALVFRGDAIENPMNNLGRLEIALRFSVDKPQGAIAALLTDEEPDGAPTLISRGFCNLAHRDGDLTPGPVPPKGKMDVAIPLHGIGYRIAEGYRLTVQIATAHWLITWPSPAAVTPKTEAGTTVLTLPVRNPTPDAPAPCEFPAPPPMEKAIVSYEVGALERHLTHNATTGRHSDRIFFDGGVFGPIGKVTVDTGTQLHDTSERIDSVHPDDPLSAEAKMEQISPFSREDWDVVTKTWSKQTTSDSEFILSARVEGWGEGSLFFETEWDHRIPRNGM